MYGQVCISPDISFVVGMLGKHLSDLDQIHWKETKKVLRYLQGTKDLMLTYRRTDTLEVVGFSDSDYAGCVDDKKSTSCYIFIMAEGNVSWKCVKQTLTTSSTMEAEYVACYEHICHAIMVAELNFSFGGHSLHFRPLKLLCDNSTNSFFRNTRSTSRSKHIDVKFYFIREKVCKVPHFNLAHTYD